MGILKYHQYIKENSTADSLDLILKKGSILYHGSLEPIKLPLRTGGYDDVLWTTKDIVIARMYIPSSPATIYTSLNLLASPRDQYSVEDILPQLGIVYTDCKYNRNRLESYKTPEIFKELQIKCDEQNSHLYSLYKKLQAYKLEYNELDKLSTKEDTPDLSNKIDQILKNWSVVEDEYEAYRKAMLNYETEKKKIIKQILLDKFGYEDYNDGNYKLKIENKKILKSNESVKGKVYKLTLNQDLKFFNYAKDRDGDLTDLDYHKLDLFRKVEKEGYDGIIINDFAQSDVMGNHGHKSYGIFKNSIDKMSVEVLVDMTHPSSDEI